MKKAAIYLSTDESYNQLFSEIKSEFLKLDPVAFTEHYLKLDGKPFKISGNGWRFLADIYRYIALKAINPDGRPIVILKGRQVGATVMAGALDLYFTASGLFGSNTPPISVLHCFPNLTHTKRFSQSKLDSLINTSTNDYINQQKLGYNPKTKKVSSNRPDNMTLKQFNGGNNLWVESLGNDSDRIRGMTCDAIFYDECFPGSQYIEVLGKRNKKTIGEIYRDFSKNKELPLVKTYNETTELFEYKKIINAWDRGERPLVQITCGNKEIRCTANHKFLTESGWQRADELRQGTLLKTSIGTDLHIRALNDDQLQIILGSFLGDGHIDNYSKGKYRLSVQHGIKQENYCSWKASMFNVKTTLIEKNGYSQKPAIKFCSKMFGLEYEFPATKITCPQWVLDKLDARGIAIWFMDDGSLSRKWNNGASGAISTCSFDEDSQKRIVEKFNSLGIECHYASYKHKKNNKYYFYVMFNKEGFAKLCDLIRPYIYPDLYYKISIIEPVKSYNWSNKFKLYGLTVVDKVCETNIIESVYDIEVEDNHNFILAPSNATKNIGGPIVHNCQDMSPTAIGVALKTLVAAKYGPPGEGIQVYFGTPKAKGSYFETGLWNQTDKRYYFLGCTNKECNHYFMLSTPGSDEWKNIWLFDQTIKCPKCGQEEDKRILVENGKWMATEPLNTDGSEKKFVGFHISQLYIPHINKNYILNQHPEHNKASSERIYYNEALGEFYSGNDMPITQDEIYQKCRDPERSFARTISSNERKTWMGVDWGGKVDGDNLSAGQSFSCVVVLSADSTGTLNVEFAYRLKSTDFQYKMDFIREMYKNYSLRLAVADIGYGQDICSELQKLYGSKFLSCMASGSLKKPVVYDKDMLQLKWNKDIYIEEVYDLMRKGKIRFPWKSYEKIDWLLEHITSMEQNQVMVGGMPKKAYQKGIGPNDGFIALIHAYMAMKFELTNGFSINLNNPVQSTIPLPKLMYLPKLK